jgi:ABC-2 type transport system permease protein
VRSLIGTGSLIRLALRRDRLVLLCSVLAIAGVSVGTVAYYLDVFASPDSRDAFAADVAATPALLGFNGPLFGRSIDVMATWRMRDLCIMLVSALTLLTVIRYSRAEEESGRQELVGAGVVARHAPLATAVLVSISAGAAAVIVVALGMIAMGLDTVGALSYAAAAFGTAALFAGVGAVASQVMPSGRGALGIGAAVLGFSYVARFTADASGVSWLVWVTPLGWAHQVRPFADHQWPVILLPLAVAGALIALAHMLLSRRDFGAGLLPARLGRARGRIGSAASLAWRQQRTTLLAWVIAYTVAGVFFGGLTAAVGDTPQALGSSSVLREFLDRYSGAAGAPSGAIFLWVIALTLGYTAALYPALAIARVRTEEESGRAELLLATPTGRIAWVASHAIIAALGTVMILLAGGLSTGLVIGAATGDVNTFWSALAGALIQVPAAWVLGAVTLLALGSLPRATIVVAWTGFLFVQVFELVGPIARLDFSIVEWVIPFFHLPRILTGDPFAPWPIVGLISVTIVVGAAGLIALRHRDMMLHG